MVMVAGYFSVPFLILAATLTGSQYRPDLTVEKLSSGKITNVHRVQTAESTVGTQVSVASRSVLFPFCSTAFFPGSRRQPPVLRIVYFFAPGKSSVHLCEQSTEEWIK